MRRFGSVRRAAPCVLLAIVALSCSDDPEPYANYALAGDGEVTLAAVQWLTDDGPVSGFLRVEGGQAELFEQWEVSYLSHGGGVFVAIPDPYAEGSPPLIAYSADGRDWQAATLPEDVEWVGEPVHADGVFLAWMKDGGEEGRIIRSEDGADWATTDLGAFEAGGLMAAGDAFFATLRADVHTKLEVHISTDRGSSWTELDLPSSWCFSGVAHAPGLYVVELMTCSEGPPTSFEVMTSTDGVTWTEPTPGRVGRFYAAGDAYLRCDDETASWTTGLFGYDVPTFSERAIRCTTLGDGFGIRHAVGISVSADGIDWEPLELPED